MAKEIYTEISIDGEQLTHYVSLELSQSFYEHHCFELVVNGDILASESPNIRATQEYVGKFVFFAFGHDRTGDNFFRGVITEASFRQAQGNWPQLVLKGHSPTYLMEGGKHRASFSDVSLREMAKSLCSNLAATDLTLCIAPAYTASIPYLSQYDESHYQYLRRLAIENGEWFYCDGQNLYFGKPQLPKAVELVYGRQLHHFRFSLSLSPGATSYYSYNESEDIHMISEPATQVGETGIFADKALEETDKLYRHTMHLPAAVHATHQNRLDNYTKQNKEGRAAATVRMEAEGDDPKVRIGGIVEIHLRQSDVSGNNDDELSEFLVTSVTHRIDNAGRYSNSFEGYSSTVQQIPATVTKPLADAQIATVKDNADPNGFGRVKVQMLWQKKSGETTEWIRVVSPDAGSSTGVEKNRGHVFIPEIGDQVMVGFEGSDPDRPFVMGGVFHGKNGTGGGQGNNVKSIVTKSGHTIRFDDTDGSESITITDKKHNFITLDTATSSITISAPENISLSAKNIDLNAKENISMTAGTDISSSAKENISLSAGENLNQHAGKDTTLAANNIISQAQEKATHIAKEMESTAKEVKVNSTQKDMLLASGKKVNMQSGEKIKLF